MQDARGTAREVKTRDTELGARTSLGPSRANHSGLLFLDVRPETCARHFTLLVESRGPVVGSNMMRKHFGWYIKNFPGAGALRRELVTAKDKDAMDVMLSAAIKNSRTILKASA